MTIHRPWTISERAEVQMMRHGGMSIAEIADRMPSRTMQAIKSMIFAEGFRIDAAVTSERVIPAKCRSESVDRKCLACSREFLAPTRFIRLCQNCKQTAAFGAALMLAALLPWQAVAHPPAVGSEEWEILSPHSAWINEQVNNVGLLCCSIADARSVDVRTVDGHWEVMFRNPEELPGPFPYGWKRVPDDAILRDRLGQVIPSPTGLSLAWWFGGRVRCFTVPTGG